MSNIKKETMEEIINAAYETPSGDNMRPWTFRASDDHIDVEFVEKDIMDKLLYRIPPLFPGDTIAFGALAENIRIAATKHFLQGEIGPVSETGNLAVQIRFTDSQASPDPFVGMIATRRTDRRPFLREPVDVSIRDKANSIARSFGGRVFWVDDQLGLRRFARIVERFERVLWGTKVFREYISHSFRFESGAEEGVSLLHMGLGWKGIFFPIFFRIAEIFPIFFHLLGLFSGWNTKSLVRHSAAIGALILDKPHNERKTYFEGGQALERIWLSLHSDGIALQPMFGPVGAIFNKRLNTGGLSAEASLWQEETIQTLQELFPGLETGTPILFFRIGKPAYPPLPPVAHRRPNIAWD